MIGIIANPLAGRRRVQKNLPYILQYINTQDISYKFLETERRGDAFKLAEQLLRTGVSRIIAIGGDGTVNEVGNSLVKKETKTPLGIIPLGSGNDLCRCLYSERNWRFVLKSVLWTNKEEEIDVGTIETERGIVRYFFNSVGIEFDRYVLENVHKLSILRGNALYLAAVAKTFLKYRGFKGKVELDGRILTETPFIIHIGNGQSMGGGLRLFPYASLRDGLLDISITAKITLLRFLLTLPKIFKGTHIKERIVEYTRVKNLKINSGKSIGLQVDGELVILPPGMVKFSLSRYKLRVLCV